MAAEYTRSVAGVYGNARPRIHRIRGLTLARAGACVSSRSCVRDGHGGDTKTMRSRRYLDAACRTTRNRPCAIRKRLHGEGYVCVHVTHMCDAHTRGGGAHAPSCRRQKRVPRRSRGRCLSTFHDGTLANRGSERM